MSLAFDCSNTFSVLLFGLVNLDNRKYDVRNVEVVDWSILLFSNL